MGVVMDLHHTEERLFALERVAERDVKHHNSTEPHAEGFSWSDSDMSQDMQQTFKELLHAGLITLDVHMPWGSNVLLTFAGSRRLSMWHEEHPKGGAA
jgi:hypothetical protein